MVNFAVDTQAPAVAPFRFLAPGELSDGEFKLVLRETLPAMSGRCPAYRFEMRRLADYARLGRIELRVGQTQDLFLYTGHIGYRVEVNFRGQRFAARSCRLLASLALRHGLPELWITCDPDNAASRRSCELAGAIFEGIVTLPTQHVFYKSGSRAKCRYRLPLKANGLPIPS